MAAEIAQMKDAKLLSEYLALENARLVGDLLERRKLLAQEIDRRLDF